MNGEPRELNAYPMARLLDVLREDLRLTGTKEGCGEGECGACAVILNGELVNSCLVPAIQVQGAEILTIEGAANHPIAAQVQEAFLRHGGVQCGICSPGVILAAANLLSHDKAPSEADIRESLAGNLCRCTGYSKIVDSVAYAASDLKGTRS